MLAPGSAGSSPKDQRRDGPTFLDVLDLGEAWQAPSLSLRLLTLFVAQSFDWIKRGGFAGGVVAEEYSYRR
jgi:hypothetical protein